MVAPWELEPPPAAATHCRWLACHGGGDWHGWGIISRRPLQLQPAATAMSLAECARVLLRRDVLATLLAGLGAVVAVAVVRAVR